MKHPLRLAALRLVVISIHLVSALHRTPCVGNAMLQEASYLLQVSRYWTGPTRRSVTFATVLLLVLVHISWEVILSPWRRSRPNETVWRSPNEIRSIRTSRTSLDRRDFSTLIRPFRVRARNKDK